MTQLKNNLSKICLLLFATTIIAGANKKEFVFDGGTINNPNMVVTVNTRPPQITATNASGCSTSINYQWQQSTDGTNFIDAPNGTAASFQPGLLITTTHFRRKAICVRGPHAYTSNVAIVIVQ